MPGYRLPVTYVHRAWNTLSPLHYLCVIVVVCECGCVDVHRAGNTLSPLHSLCVIVAVYECGCAYIHRAWNTLSPLHSLCVIVVVYECGCADVSPDPGTGSNTLSTPIGWVLYTDLVSDLLYL